MTYSSANTTISSSQILKLSQRKLFFGRKDIEVNLVKDKITITEQSLLRSVVVEEKLSSLDENTQQSSHKSLRWFSISLLLSGLFAVASYDLYSFETARVDSFLGLGLLAIVMVIAWSKTYSNSLSLLSFFYKNGQHAFSLYSNNPDQKSFNAFVNQLKESIDRNNNLGSLQLLIEKLPTEVLLSEITTSLTETLKNRGVDANHYLIFVQNLFSTHEVTECH